jgi:hypothetical protein
MSMTAHSLACFSFYVVFCFSPSLSYFHMSRYTRSKIILPKAIVFLSFLWYFLMFISFSVFFYAIHIIKTTAFSSFDFSYRCLFSFFFFFYFYFFVFARKKGKKRLTRNTSVHIDVVAISMSHNKFVYII